MSEFEFSSLSSDSSSEDEILPSTSKTKHRTKSDLKTIKVSKELRLYYSSLFIDSFSLIDLFIKTKQLGYDSFLKCFDAVHFHQIYAKNKGEVKNMSVTPHHYITTTQDALAVAAKFLRSHSKEARIGAVYLLYSLHKTQPLKTYPINIKLEPIDYKNTKELVEKYLCEGLMHPAYCFYDLDTRKKITITAAVVNPCLEANYPRSEVRKHMGRVADKYFQIEYEEREEFDIFNKLQLIEPQMRNELAYINKLSNSALGRDVAQEYKVGLSKVLVEIDIAEKINKIEENNVVGTACTNKRRYKMCQTRAFPGVNDDILQDMVITPEPSNPSEGTVKCGSKKKHKLPKKTKRFGKKKSCTPAIKEEPGSLSNTCALSDSSCSSDASDNELEDKYGNMLWRILEGDVDHELTDQYTNREENHIV